MEKNASVSELRLRRHSSLCYAKVYFCNHLIIRFIPLNFQRISNDVLTSHYYIKICIYFFPFTVPSNIIVPQRFRYQPSVSDQSFTDVTVLYLLYLYVTFNSSWFSLKYFCTENENGHVRRTLQYTIHHHHA
jgi:hypothetical protein